MAARYTESVTVLRGHLEEMFLALDAAAGYHAADDLARQYKNVGGAFRPSNLTTRLERSRERLEGYLQEESTDVPQE